MKSQIAKRIQPFCSMVVVGVLVFLAATAHASDGDDAEWYGWQPMVVDAGAVGLFATGYELDKPALISAGMILYEVGPPIIHGLHGNIGRGVGSLVLRLGFGYLALTVGFGLLAELGYTPMILMPLTAMAIDWFALSYKSGVASSESKSQGLQLQWRF